MRYQTRLSHVTEYNGIMDIARKFTMMFTIGNGSMLDTPRLKGWVLWQSPLRGDSQDFAKWYPNKEAAEQALKVMA
jgi:hypothetical protein